jgi:hypothetical protein
LFILTAITVVRTLAIIPDTVFTRGIFDVTRRNYSTAKQQVAEDRLHRSRVESTLVQHDGNIICNRDEISGSGSVDVVGEDLVGWYNIRMRTAPRKK